MTNSCNLFDLLTGNICLLCSIFTHCFDIRCCNKVLRSSKDSQSARCILLVVGKLGRLCFGHALHGLLRFLFGFWMSLTSMLCAKARFSRLRWFHFTYHIFRQPTMWKAYLHVWRHILYKHINIYIHIHINSIILYKYSATIPLTSVMVMVTTYWQLVVFRMHGVCMGSEPYGRNTARSV